MTERDERHDDEGPSPLKKSDQSEVSRVRPAQEQAWKSVLGPSFGEQVWKSVLGVQLGPAFGEQAWKSVLGPSFGEQVWKSVLGVQLGPLLRDRTRHVVQELLRRATVPSNLRVLSNVTSDDILDFTLEHGVSLYLVPRASVASSMLAARDHGSVRRLLGDKRNEILADCRDVLECCDDAKTLAYREFALQAVTALESDLFGPAQALAANLLDVLNSRALEPDLKRAAKRRSGESIADVKSRIDDLDAWEGYVASALWSTFQHYFRERGDVVPHSFSRHATVHATGRRQYSRRSAVQGIMAVTGAVGFLNGLY